MAITATQGTFNPINYGFEWTADGWYKFDYVQAHATAKRERDAAVVALRKEGRQVKKWTASRQTVRRGGIGTGHPEIDEVVTVYGYDVIG